MKQQHLVTSYLSRPTYDYGHLCVFNSRTKIDNTVPNIQEFSSQLSGSTIFSHVDIVTVFHPILFHPDDIPKNDFFPKLKIVIAEKDIHRHTVDKCIKHQRERLADWNSNSSFWVGCGRAQSAWNYVKIGQLQASFAVNTDPAVKVLSETTVTALKRSSREVHYDLRPTDRSLCCVTTDRLNILSVVLLPLCLGKNTPLTPMDFYTPKRQPSLALQEA